MLFAYLTNYQPIYQIKITHDAFDQHLKIYPIKSEPKFIVLVTYLTINQQLPNFMHNFDSQSTMT